MCTHIIMRMLWYHPTVRYETLRGGRDVVRKKVQGAKTFNRVVRNYAIT